MCPKNSADIWSCFQAATLSLRRPPATRARWSCCDAKAAPPNTQTVPHPPQVLLAGMPALHEKLPVVSKPVQVLAEADGVLVALLAAAQRGPQRVELHQIRALFQGQQYKQVAAIAHRVTFECVWVVRVLQGHERHRR